ncbi:MAG: hypothetical protein RI988_3809 [Pseudomonadota bacterium]|jgi:pilus assembly protein CpaE
MAAELLIVSPDPALAETISREARLVAPALQLRVEPGDARHAARAIREHAPALLVLGHPHLEGADLRALAEASATHPKTAVLLLTTDPTPQMLLAAMRAGVREVVPLPAQGGEIGQALARLLAWASPASSGAAHAPGVVLALMSSKGGAGSTFLATSLAAALADRGARTAVLDLDLAHGDAAVFLSDQPEATSLSDLAAQHARLDGALLESALLACGPHLRLLAAPVRTDAAMGVRPESVSRIVELAATRFDAVVLDLGRGPDAATLPALDLAGTIALVTAPTLAGLHGARRALTLLRELDVARSRVELVVNRVGQPGELTPADLLRALGFSRAREVPDSAQAVAVATDHGVPIGRHAPRDPAARALAAWAEELCPQARPQAGAARSWLRSLGWSRAAA